MYSHTNNVYLSGSTGMFTGTTTINPFSASTSLSASYPALTGVVPALDYYAISDNKMIVTYQAPAGIGSFDIIVVNDAGYTKLSTDSYNPNYSTQYPYVSGVQVTNPN